MNHRFITKKTEQPEMAPDNPITTSLAVASDLPESGIPYEGSRNSEPIQSPRGASLPSEAGPLSSCPPVRVAPKVASPDRAPPTEVPTSSPDETGEPAELRSALPSRGRLPPGVHTEIKKTRKYLTRAPVTITTPRTSPVPTSLPPPDRAYPQAAPHPLRVEARDSFSTPHPAASSAASPSVIRPQQSGTELRSVPAPSSTPPQKDIYSGGTQVPATSTTSGLADLIRVYQIFLHRHGVEDEVLAAESLAYLRQLAKLINNFPEGVSWYKGPPA